jgi:hypothetical protein
MSQSRYAYPEFSGALQQKSTIHIKKPNELRRVKNVDFSTVLGAIRRRMGAQSSVLTLPKLPLDLPPLGAFIARFPSAIEIWAAQNDSVSSPTSALLKYWTGPGATAWTNIATGLQKSTEINLTSDLDEVWVSVYDPVTDIIYDPFTVDGSHNVSTIRQLQFAPKARLYMEFNGAMWAFDCVANGVRYRNRAYKSSGPAGVVAFARSAQTDVPISFTLVDQVPTMTGASTPAGAVAASTTFVGYNAWWAFSGTLLRNSGTWFTGPQPTPTGWISYDFGVGVTKVITHYALTPVPTDATIGGTTDDPKSAPKTWTLEGSNDNSSWTVIDTQTNAPAWAVAERRLYTTANTTAYRYYRINVSANQGGASAQSLVMISEIEFLNTATNVTLLQLAVDSARYLKPGMALDVYTAGTETKTYDLTVNSVDKANDIITFLPYSQIFAPGAVNTATDVITVADASKLLTGTPVLFSTTGALPTGLSAGVTYYAINVSGTTFKVATSLLNATLGVAVDITATGSGNHTVKLSYIIGNKDELWAHGRKGMLTRFWNTDYRNPEAADWIKLPPTFDALDQINAVGKISNRLFIFTKNTMIRYDSQNVLPLRNDVGCIAQKSICYYDNYMIWLDAKGNIWVRNEEAGAMDMISQAIQDTMSSIPQSQLPQATAVCVGSKYKLYLGQVSSQSVRVVYDFLTNQWTEERWTPQQPMQFEYTYNNTAHPHFFDEKGQLWVDEQGNDDNGAVIAMRAELGDDTLGVDEVKAFYGIKVYALAVAACKVLVSIDGGQFNDCGQITKPIQTISFPRDLPKGTTINLRFVDSSSLKPVQIDRAVLYYNSEEDTFRATR